MCFHIKIEQNNLIGSSQHIVASSGFTVDPESQPAAGMALTVLITGLHLLSAGTSMVEAWSWNPPLGFRVHFPIDRRVGWPPDLPWEASHTVEHCFYKKRNLSFKTDNLWTLEVASMSG